jgi:hypothetical protein
MLENKPTEGLKRFVMAQGESGMLHLYDRELWEFIQSNIQHTLGFITDSDDFEVLHQMQELANEDMELEN